MAAATELTEYTPKEGFKKNNTIASGYGDDEDDEFVIDDEPALEENNHKPVAEDSPPSINPSSLFTPDTQASKDKDNETIDTTYPPNNTNDNKPELNETPTTQTTASPLSSSISPLPTPSPIPSHASVSSPSTPNGSPKPSHPSKQVITSSLLSSSGGVTPVGSPENERMVLSYNERIKMYEDVLQSDILEIHLLRELAWQGVPESKGLRSLYWKILLHYLPTNKSLWESSLARDRKLYKDFVQELVIDPHANNEKHSDHPLCLDQDSKWNAFFKDNEILAEIDKDVKRTFPHLHFFNKISETGQTIESIHYHALKRVLFIYAKLNPGIRYVQGMNELLGPIYYTFATDSNEEFKEHAEADSFFCFTNLMSEWRDNFCKTLDKSEMGIVANMKHLNMKFKDHDPELWGDLEEKKMNPQFYTFRWITLLLSQEFELPDVLRLWDSLFADPDRFNFFYCFCCAMLICVRDRILSGTFADNLKLLQSYPPIDFQVIFATALKVHENTYEPPPPRKRTETPSPTHTSSHTSTPSPTPSTTSSKLSMPSLFSKKAPTSATAPKAQDKPQEKQTFNLPLGLGKFQI